MTPQDLEPDAFVTDYTGQPGQRTFFVQARAGDAVRTHLIEKQQVAVLADKLREVLLLVDPTDPISTASPERDPALRLETPIEPEWRVGTIGLSYDDSDERVIVAFRPVNDAEDPTSELEEPPDPDDFAIRYRLRRDQVRAFVLHALSVVGEGRPLCQLCGLPMDPDGHLCPASNGHRSEV